MISVINVTVDPATGYYRNELVGLSTDTIASANLGTIANGSILYEIDTGKMYVYNIANSKWIAVDDQSQRS